MPLEKDFAAGVIQGMAKDPHLEEFAWRMFRTRDTLVTSGAAAISWADLIDQRGWTRGDPAVQGFCTGVVDSLCRAGKCIIIPISVMAEPQPDKHRDLNDAILRTLTPPFAATVSLAKSGPDGQLTWDTEHPMAPHRHLKDWGTLRCGFTVLEIGSCPGERTLYYLLGFGSIARWPYGSDKVYLMAMADDQFGIWKHDGGLEALGELIGKPCEPR